MVEVVGTYLVQSRLLDDLEHRLVVSVNGFNSLLQT